MGGREFRRAGAWIVALGFVCRQYLAQAAKPYSFIFRPAERFDAIKSSLVIK
jgi:hypothetical protein